MTFYLNHTQVTMYGTLYNRTSDLTYDFEHTQSYHDRVTDCYDSDEGCTHYDTKCVTAREAIRKYGRTSGKSVKRLVWADQDAAS